MSAIKPASTLAAMLLVLCGCTSVLIQPDPVTIGPSSIEIAFSPPLRSGVDTRKSIRAHLDVKTAEELPLRCGLQADPFRCRKEIMYPDGRIIHAEAILFLHNGETLKIPGDVGGCDEVRGHCAVWFQVNVYRRRLEVDRVRFTASAPIRVKSIEWAEAMPK